MKKFLLLVLGLSILFSCKDCDEACSSFNFDSEEVKWFLFPENKDIYTFNSSEGNIITLEKEIYEYTEGSYVIEKRCNYNFLGPSASNENCTPFLTATYVSDNLEIVNEISQSDSYVESLIGIKKNADRVFSFEVEDFLQEPEVFIFSESLEANDLIYNDVISFDLDDESGTLYISKGNGLIRIVLDDIVYDLELD